MKYWIAINPTVTHEDRNAFEIAGQGANVWITDDSLAATAWGARIGATASEYAETNALIEAAKAANPAPLMFGAQINGVPQSVTMRQARLALLGAGLLTAVTNAIAALPEPQKSAALIEWEYSNEVWRSKGFVVDMAGALGLTSQQLDGLFIAASAL